MTIRPITSADREEYLSMAREFYQSDVVMHPIPDEHLERTFEELMRGDVYAAADILENDGTVIGYALYAKTFSAEAGGMVLWIEELFVKVPYRGNGIGRMYFERLLQALPPEVKRVRLEVERDNVRAVHLYESFGFAFMEYESMFLER